MSSWRHDAIRKPYAFVAILALVPMNVRATVAGTLRMSLTIGLLIALMAVLAFQPQHAKASSHAGQPMASGNDRTALSCDEARF
jgi:hypothetical protein